LAIPVRGVAKNSTSGQQELNCDIQSGLQKMSCAKFLRNKIIQKNVALHSLVKSRKKTESTKLFRSTSKGMASSSSSRPSPLMTVSEYELGERARITTASRLLQTAGLPDDLKRLAISAVMEGEFGMQHLQNHRVSVAKDLLKIDVCTLIRGRWSQLEAAAKTLIHKPPFPPTDPVRPCACATCTFVVLSAKKNQ
jgi:hypothetical protein